MDKDMEDVDKRVDWLHSEHCSAAGDIFGEPQKTTRIGDEYQALIPSFMTENERLQFIELPLCHDAKTYFQKFSLPIPVTWVQTNIQESAKGKSGILVSEMDSGLLLVPDSASESWSVIEHDSFLLGLYLFGKNLRVVNKFIGNKGMPNVLSYYYGKFCKNGEHQKWSMYRKKRSRKSIPGKKIFKGWRLQELLSRLLPNVTDECKTTLTQVTRTFEEGNLSFDKYVFALRDAVGINLLVESIAIGKRKQDLTSRIKKPWKNRKLHSACPSMKTEEIVNILKERIGLSKGRLNDLFWEAVWPRLLARGWHSEQPRNYALQKSKHSLVFLAPGVAKYSRRSLEKGSQYFDSLTEVLNKVASEPQLLENEPDQQDILVEPRVKLGSDDDKQDLMKCTIVDTSLVGGVFEVKELTSSPADMEVSCSVSRETEQDTTEEEAPINKDIVNNLDHAVVSKIEDETSIDISTNGKLKLVTKTKSKRRRFNNNNNNNNTKNDKTSGEDEAMDLTNPRVRVGPVSDIDGDNSSRSTKPSSVVHESGNGQRQSRRNRPLTIKALEALENGFLDPKKKRRGSKEDGTRRRVRAKTALVSSCGARCIENQADGVFNATLHIVSESPKCFEA